MKNKILITGFNGLIGSSFIKLLSNYELFLISRNPTNLIPKDNEHLIFIDLAKEIDFSKVPNDIDTIIHLAQSLNYKNFPKQADDIFRVNVFSTMQLLEFARKNNVKRFIYASSGSVYRKNNMKNLKEDCSNFSSELDFYSKSKVISELLINSYKKYFFTIILRFFFVYGPYQKSYMFIPTLINNILNENEIFLDNEQGIKLNPIYVDDAAFALLKAITLKGNYKINIAGKEILSIHQLCQIINNILQKKMKLKIIDKKSLNIIADIKQMKTLLHYPQVSFKEGIKKVIESMF